jgi:hypothetical protein
VRGDFLFCWYWWNCWGERWLFVLLILVELLRWEMIVCFVDISGIVEVRGDYLFCWYWWNCWQSLLYFLFIIS